MSRIGKQPIPIPSGVEVKIGNDVVEVKGPKGALTTPVCSVLSYEVADGKVVITRLDEYIDSARSAELRAFGR